MGNTYYLDGRKVTMKIGAAIGEALDYLKGEWEQFEKEAVESSLRKRIRS
jgi:hypothetical protein